MNTVLVGASNKPERYAWKAFHLLREKGHQVFPVHPRIKDLEGIPVHASPGEIGEPVDTITLYVSAAWSDDMLEDLLALGPRRIIFNPGSENPRLEAAALAAGIQCQHGCTLVLLHTGQY